MTTDTTAERGVDEALTRFEEMDKVSLLNAKADIDSRLRRARADLADAKRRAWENRTRVPDEEFDAMNERIRRLSSASQRAQTALAVKATQRKERGARLNDVFVEVARQTLPRDIYMGIVEQACAASQR